MRYIVLALLFIAVITTASYLGLTQKREPQATTPSPTIQTSQASKTISEITQTPNSQNVTDEANLFTLTLPVTWKIVKEGAQGVRVSGIEAESPEFMMRSDTNAEGPFTPIYYESGASLHVSVQNDVSATTQKPAGVITDEKPYTIDGVRGTYFTFKEPSTAEGQLHGVQFVRNDQSYYFRFGYNPETYTDGEQMFQAIIDSVIFSSE